MLIKSVIYDQLGADVKGVLDVASTEHLTEIFDTYEVKCEPSGIKLISPCFKVTNIKYTKVTDNKKEAYIRTNDGSYLVYSDDGKRNFRHSGPVADKMKMAAICIVPDGDSDIPIENDITDHLYIASTTIRSVLDHMCPVDNSVPEPTRKNNAAARSVLSHALKYIRDNFATSTQYITNTRAQGQMAKDASTITKLQLELQSKNIRLSELEEEVKQLKKQNLDFQRNGVLEDILSNHRAPAKEPPKNVVSFIAGDPSLNLYPIKSWIDDEQSTHVSTGILETDDWFLLGTNCYRDRSVYEHIRTDGYASYVWVGDGLDDQGKRTLRNPTPHEVSKLIEVAGWEMSNCRCKQLTYDLEYGNWFALVEPEPAVNDQGEACDLPF